MYFFHKCRKSASGRQLTGAETAARKPEDQTMGMARAAALIRENIKYPDGRPVEESSSRTPRSAGSARPQCARKKDLRPRSRRHPDRDPMLVLRHGNHGYGPHTIKAVWGFNGTERPGAVYLAAVLAAHAQKGCRPSGSMGTTCRTPATRHPG